MPALLLIALLVAAEPPDAGAAPPLIAAGASTPGSIYQPAQTTTSATLALADCLRLAHRQGRRAIQAGEELRLAESALGAARRDYGPQPTATIGAGWSGSGTSPRPGDDQRATVGATQRLPTGGEVGVSATAARNRTAGSTATTSDEVALTARQPLLRGAGPTAWRQPLTAAERALADARRAHLRDRQDISVDTARSFWGLQRRQEEVSQAQAAAQRAAFLREQSEALMAVGKRGADDLFRAETNLLSAQQQALDSVAGFEAAVDALRLDLALAPGTTIAIDQTPPKLLRWIIDAGRAIAAALERRLDLASAAERIDDAERAVVLARDGLWPRLDATGRMAWGGVLDQGANQSVRGPPNWRVGLELDLPLATQHQEFALEQALVARTRARRAAAELRERVVNEILDAIRDLRRAEDSLAIQDRNRIQATRRAEKASLDFQAGTASNRDVVEAQGEVRAAENAWYAALVAYRVSELSLRRATNCLTIDANGAWDESPTPYASVEPK
ncbi:type I secretion outer membrane protein [Planctomycetota bacterium]|nr:type I secretion outer membrane protein [Planctomycetota bacterium]